MEGTYDNLKQLNDFHTADFGIIYRITITGLICDKFGVDRRHSNKGSILTFDLDKFVRICKTYGLGDNEYVLDIQIKLTDVGSDDNPSITPSLPSPRHFSTKDFPPKCYHCNVNGFMTNDQYEEHGIRMHKNLPLYLSWAGIPRKTWNNAARNVMGAGITKTNILSLNWSQRIFCL